MPHPAGAVAPRGAGRCSQGGCQAAGGQQCSACLVCPAGWMAPREAVRLATEAAQQEEVSLRVSEALPAA